MQDSAISGVTRTNNQPQDVIRLAQNACHRHRYPDSALTTAAIPAKRSAMAWHGLTLSQPFPGGVTASQTWPPNPTRIPT